MTDTLRDRIARATWISHRDRQLAQLGMKPSEYAADIPVPDWAYAIADAVIRELEAAYVLVPKNVTLVQWADEAFKGQTPGKLKHERITEWTTDE